MKELEDKNKVSNEELLEVLDEEEVLDSDSVMESYFSDDDYKNFFRMIKKFPVLTKEENIELALKAQGGDSIASEKLINHNLRLVVSSANKYRNRIKHMKVLDVIQEGVIGLMKCVPKFDPNKGAFSTYATNYIEGYIKTAIYNMDAEIRKPINIEIVKGNYQKIINNCMKNGEDIPSDEELLKTLKISKETLKYLKESQKLDPISVNIKVGDDDEESELLDFVKVKDNSYNDVIAKIDNHILFSILKSVLKPLDYYIIYYRFLNDEIITEVNIGKELNITKQGINQKMDKALEIIKPYMDKNSLLYKKELSKLYKNNMIDWINTSPIEPKNIILFLYLSDELSDIERKILYLQFFGEYKLEWYRRKLMLKEDELEKTKETLMLKIKEVYQNIEPFNEFKNNLLSKYKSKIFKIKLDEKIEFIDYENIKKTYDNMSYEEIIELFNKNNIVLNDKERKLIERYFRIPTNNKIKSKVINREVYLLEFGYKEKTKNISKEKLYKSFLENKNQFSDEQQLFLECFFFKVKAKKEFENIYPYSSIYSHRNILIEKLESIYYCIYNYFQNSFNKEKYLYIKKKFPRKLTEERIVLLDLYYGLNGDSLSIKQIAELLNEDYIKIQGKIRDARKFCISLYNNRTNLLTTDFSKYIPFILSEEIDLSNETRDILKMHIIDNMSYDEIRIKNNLGNISISNIITDGLRRIDFYRFNMIENKKITQDELKDFFNHYSKNITPLEAKVIIFKTIKLMNNNDIANILGISKNDVEKTITKFNRLYKKYQIKDVLIDEEDILNEINSHSSESVIDDFDKELLSFYYGLKTRFNLEGKKLSKKELMIKYSLSEAVVSKKISLLCDDIKSKKAGYLKNELLYISRSELDEILNNPHLPISDKEREIICYLFELKGFPYKTLDELKGIFGDTKNSLRRRYQRAILTIYKYINKEIEGIINYELDVIPNLKYFSTSDNLFLNEYYKNKLSIKEISEKYNLSYDVVCNIFNRLKDNLIEMIKNPKAKKFDFEFYREHKNDSKLPFYGDTELLKTIFDLYMGESTIKRLGVPEIIQELNLNNQVMTVRIALNNFMLAFYKLKDGIYKVKNFSYEEIKDYYDMNYLNMDEEDKIVYEKFFRQRNDKSKINGTKSDISYEIIYDLLKEKYPNLFDIETASIKEVTIILNKYYYKMTKYIKNYLMYICGLTEREFMSGKEKNHVYRILNKLEMVRKRNTKESVLKKKLEK